MIDEEIVKLLRSIPTTLLDISQLLSLLNYRNELIDNKKYNDESLYIHALQHINEQIKKSLQL